jgi:flagellar assembly protein FliH
LNVAEAPEAAFMQHPLFQTLARMAAQSLQNDASLATRLAETPAQARSLMPPLQRPAAASKAGAPWLPDELSGVQHTPWGNHIGASGGHAARGDVQKTLEEARQAAGEIRQAAQEEAHKLLSQAQADSQELLHQAEAQAEEIRRSAQHAGVLAANAATAQLLRAATSIVEEVNSWRESVLSKGEMMMLRLVIEIAQSIFGEGIPLDPDTLGQAFTRALGEAKTLGDLRIHAHPEDVAALNPLWVQQQSTMSGQHIELIPSDIIKRGGCFVEGQFGSVDARVDTQFDLVQKTLFTTLGRVEGENA